MKFSVELVGSIFQDGIFCSQLPVLVPVHRERVDYSRLRTGTEGTVFSRRIVTN
jgi:hypothetical protein